MEEEEKDPTKPFFYLETLGSRHFEVLVVILSLRRGSAAHFGGLLASCLHFSPLSGSCYNSFQQENILLK